MKQQLIWILPIFLIILACKKKSPVIPVSAISNEISISTEITLSSKVIHTPKVGFMSNYLTKPSWKNKSFLDSVKKLGLEIIRFPGGTESQYFDWRTGRSISSSNWGGTGLQSHNYIGTVPHVSYPLSELKYFFDATGVKPIFCLNLLTKNLSDQLQMLTTARDLGIPVEYIELGNELFFTDADFINKYPIPNDYVTDIKNNWIPSIQTQFPGAKIAVIGSYDFTTDLNGNNVANRIFNWNSAVYNQISTNQAITFHYYLPPNTTTLNNPVLSQALAAPFKHWPVLKQNTIANVPTGMDIFITEYNLNDGNQTSYSFASSWAHGLYTSTLFLLMLEEPKIKMILNHQLTGSPSYASLTSYTPYGDTLTNNLSPEGNAMRLIHNTLIGSDSCIKLIFQSNPVITASNINYPSLIGFCVIKNNKRNLLILNLSETPFTLQFHKISASQLNFETITSRAPLQKNISTGQLIISKGIIKDSLKVPSFSLTSLRD